VKVSIIIPVLNQLEFTKICLKSIIKNTTRGEYEVIAVDNGSTDKTSGYLKKMGIKTISNKTNLGVAKAWNQGVKASKYDFTCIINNDLVLSEGWLQALVDFYGTRPDAGVVSPGTREGVLDYNFDSYAFNYTRAMARVYEKEIYGWCMLVKKDRFEKAGMFDETFKIGVGEDRDFYRRLKERGFNSYITGSSFVHHFRSQTLNVMRKEKGKAFEDNNIKVLKERWGEGRDGYFTRKTKSVLKALKNGYMKARYGHLLLEK
jgi:GT2 family glycosyltransferase